MYWNNTAAGSFIPYDQIVAFGHDAISQHTLTVNSKLYIIFMPTTFFYYGHSGIILVISLELNYFKQGNT